MTQKLILTTTCILLGLGVTACGLSPAAQPLRLSGPVGANYDRDLVECRNIAGRYDNEKTSEGAVAGALIGAAAGAIESHEEAIAGAFVGGLIGAGEGTLEKEKSQREMTIRCLQNKGHPVIG